LDVRSGKIKLMAGLTKKDLKEVKFFYYKRGYSAREIAESFNVSIDVVYGFMQRYNLPRRDYFELNRVRFERKKPSFIIKKKLTEREKQLKIAGIMLYWAEGNKQCGRNWTVDLANSNPEIAKLFLKFLRTICGVDEKRIRVLLYCYANQNSEVLKKDWSKMTDIPLTQFTKPYIRKDFLPEKSGKMRHGLVHIRYSDKKLLLQIEEWIKDYIERVLQ